MNNVIWIILTLLMVNLTLGCEYLILVRGIELESRPKIIKFARWGSGVFKGGASLGFMTYFYVLSQDIGLADSSQIYVEAIGYALLASVIGDLLLVGESEIYFLSGLIAFFIAHIAYAVAFIDPLLRSNITPSILMISGLVIGVSLASLIAYKSFHHHIPVSLRLPSMSYTIVIAVMVISALCHSIYLECFTIAIGAIVFWLSDLAVAMQRFHIDHLAYRGFYVRLWGLPFYYIAQLVMASELTIRH